MASSRSAMLSRVTLAMIWPNPWKLMHSIVVLSKQRPTGSQASRHRKKCIQVPIAIRFHCGRRHKQLGTIWHHDLQSVARNCSKLARVLTLPISNLKSSSAVSASSGFSCCFKIEQNTACVASQLSRTVISKGVARILNDDTDRDMVDRSGPQGRLSREHGKSPELQLWGC